MQRVSQMFRATPSPSPTFGRSESAVRSSRTAVASPTPSVGSLRRSALPQVPSRASASSLPALDFSHQGVSDVMQLLTLEPRSGLALGTNGSHQVASLQRKQAERARAAAEAEEAEARRSDRFNFGAAGPVKATGASSLWGGRAGNGGGGGGVGGSAGGAVPAPLPNSGAGGSGAGGPEVTEGGDGLIIVRAGEQAYAFNPDAPVGVDPVYAAAPGRNGGGQKGKQQAARTVSEHELLFRSLYMQHLAGRGAAQSAAHSSVANTVAGATAAEDLRSVELLSAPYAMGRAYYRAQHLVLANNSLTSLPLASLCCVLCGLLLPALDAVIAGFFTCLRSPDPDVLEAEALAAASRLPPLLQSSRASVLAAAPAAIAQEHRRTFLRFITTLDLSFNAIETIDVDPLWPRAAPYSKGYLDTSSDTDSVDEDGIHHSDASPLHSRFNADACKAADDQRRQRQERTRQAPIVALQRTMGKALDRSKAPKDGDLRERLIAALPAPTPLEVVLATGAPLMEWSGTRAWTAAEMQELATRGPARSSVTANPPKRPQRGGGAGAGRSAPEGAVDPDVPFGALRSLVTLHLHSNRLRSYREVLKLAPIVQRSLQHLTWHGNEAIDAVKWKAHAAAVVAFPNLKTLNFTLVQRDFNAK